MSNTTDFPHQKQKERIVDITITMTVILQCQTNFTAKNGLSCRDKVYLGVEQDLVIHQEFLIPGVLGGYLECIHFSELIWDIIGPVQPVFLIFSWSWTESLDKKRPVSEISVVHHLSSCWPTHRIPITVPKKVKATARMPRIEIRKQNTSSNKILPFPWLLPDGYFKKSIQYTEVCTSRSSWYVWELSWIGIQEDAIINLCQFSPIVISNSVQKIPINQHSFFMQKFPVFAFFGVTPQKNFKSPPIWQYWRQQPSP